MTIPEAITTQLLIEKTIVTKVRFLQELLNAPKETVTSMSSKLSKDIVAAKQLTPSKPLTEEML